MNKSIYTDEQKALAERLRGARKHMGLRQEDAAKLLGMTQSSLSRYEQGQRRVDIIHLREFARVYKKPISFFLP